MTRLHEPQRPASHDANLDPTLVRRMAASDDGSAGESHVLSACAPPGPKLSEFPRVFRSSVERLRDRYRELYQLPVVEYEDGSRSFHQGRLLKCGRLNLLFLKGDYAQMAFQHGRLLGDQIVAGAPPQSARMVANALANSTGLLGRLQQLAAEAIHHLVTDTMLNFSVEASKRVLGEAESLDEAVAISEATGIPIHVLVRALFNPETLLLLAKTGAGRYSPAAGMLTPTVVPASCCSGFAAWGRYTRDGRMLIGRNMDYPLNGSYDRFPTVIYFEPTGRSLRYMTFVSAGIHNAGLNAYNEAGIYLSSHTVPTSEMSTRGVPVFATANQVIRRARSFDMAVELMRSFRPPTGWAYLIASTKERRVGTVELSNQHIAVREATGDCHVQTNHFITDEMRHRHLFLNRSVDEDSECRFLRIRQRIEQAAGELDVKEIASILADQHDPLVQEVRGLGNTVGVHTNMTSLVLDPERQRAFVAVGDAPVVHTEYVEVPLVGSFDRSEEPQGILPTFENRDFPRKYPAQWKALRFFIQAKCAYEQANDEARAYECLRAAAAADPANPAYHFQTGIFALKNREVDAACLSFDQVLELPHVTDQLRRLAAYYRGRAHADRGRAHEAIQDLTRVVDDPTTDIKLGTAARRSLWRVRALGRYPLKRRSLMVMMQQSDMLRY